jgi:hypothetical protein
MNNPLGYIVERKAVRTSHWLLHVQFVIFLHYFRTAESNTSPERLETRQRTASLNSERPALP